MIALRRELVEPLGALGGGGETFTGVTIDSRLAGAGDVFVAVRGGVDYVADASARGAATLVPDDAHAALAAIGAAVRAQSRAKIVAITGSVGKTSTKDILGALCSAAAHTVVAEHGYNNEIGVPLTLCRIEADTEIAIVEMGMRGLGQISALCEIARPDVGVVTSVGPVHLELLGTLENVARAKAELVAALPPGGTAVVPAGAPELSAFLGRVDVDVVRVGEDVELTAFESERERSRVVVTFADGARAELELPTVARHQADNALFAVAAYRVLGLPLSALGAIDVRFSRWRGEELPLPGGGLLINDAWNANPPAMRAALAHLAARAGERRRVAVLGDMAELGPDAPHYHEEIGRLAAAAGVDVLIAVGEQARGYLGGGVAELRWVSDAEAAARELDTVLRPGDCVLLKGSRVIGLERLADEIAAVRA